MNLLLSFWCVSLHSHPHITVILYAIQLVLVVFLYTNETNGRLTQLHSFFVSICSTYTKTLLLAFHVINVIYPFFLFPQIVGRKQHIECHSTRADAFFTNFLTGSGQGLFQTYLISSLNPPLSVEALTIF